MEVISEAKFVRIAPDKLRLVANQIKGMKLNKALAILQFNKKAASISLAVLLKQAKDQVKEKSRDEERLVVKQITVNEGPKLKRRRFLQQGRSTTILKRMSHIMVVLSDEPSLKLKAQSAKEKEKNENSKK